MDYQQTLDFLFSQLPVYQKEGASALNKKLDKTLDFCKYLGNPHTKFKSIHVAGTNGKGSVSHMLAAALFKKGFKTGLYTSPHLKSFTERIKINGVEVEQSFVVDFVQLHQEKILELKPSFFEITVVMAFEYFAQKEVDYAVIEVGLGGRFDSTNVIIPELSVITNISKDHTQILGDTLEEIAGEKAGIIKNNIPVVIGEFHGETFPVFESKTIDCNSKLIRAFDGLKGNEDYAQKNLNTASVALQTIFDDTYHDCVELIEGYQQITNFKGRWQLIQNEPKVVCDTGHNVAGVNEVLKKLAKEDYDKLFVILGMVSDKDHDEVLKLFPKDAVYVFVNAALPRMLNNKELQSKADKFGLRGICIENVNEALAYVKSQANKNDFVLIGGSTFVVADLNEL